MDVLHFPLTSGPPTGGLRVFWWLRGWWLFLGGGGLVVAPYLSLPARRWLPVPLMCGPPGAPWLGLVSAGALVVLREASCRGWSAGHGGSRLWLVGPMVLGLSRFPPEGVPALLCCG